ncbi:MAG: CPBP family intramembrane metalloprotease [Deltaproteobacteria bacterium]|nr:MAG: CPBP family intramembrane metalloprotease [Deltaproteobacteria bacterium]
MGRLRTWLEESFAGTDLSSGVIASVTALVLLVSRYRGGVGGYHRLFGSAFSGHPFEPLYDHLYWFGASFVLYGLIPLGIVLLLPGERLRDYGIGLGAWRLGLKVTLLFAAVMVPLVFVVSRIEGLGFTRTYPLDPDAVRSWTFFWVYEPWYALYFVAWEFLFRGFLLFGLARRIGTHAIWVQLIPFALMHAGKPELEAYGSIVAGVALGILALRTRSFWWGAFLHAGIAACMDLVSAAARIP